MLITLDLTPACQVVCLLLVLMVHPGTQQHCQDHEECRGERPLLPTGCCPVEAGQECQPANGTFCDAELGFTCVNASGGVLENGTGLCKGRYNLNITSRGETEVNLAWTAFAPPGYMFEYVLLYRVGSSHANLSEWSRREIGNQPFYTMRRLSPATLYFLKIAVWENAFSEILGNTSETVMAETLPVELCEHIGHAYQVGERFIHECEDNCTCLPTGKIQCIPLCPELPELENGCHRVYGEQCCEYSIVCPEIGEVCSHDGIDYSHGEEFELGCQICTCNNSQLVCAYPEECHVMEPTDECAHPISREVDGQCCPEWHCACNYENRTYDQMAYFTSSHCNLCQCDNEDSVQCTPDCPPVEMVLPDAACPDPHIRQDGCCDTLHCHDPNLDMAQYIRRMFALSYSPATLTLSFEVNPPAEVNGVPSYCQYEILYANTSDPFVTWTHRLVQPVDIQLHHDQPYLLEPTEALTRDNAIVVGDRAYVTLSGMYPDTTYYVKIIPLDGTLDDMPGHSHEDFNYSDSRISAMVVVKTMPLDNITSCFHNGMEILHGKHVDSDCGQICKCIMGKITCYSTCEEELVIVAASLTCPRPHLVKQEGDCCPRWICNPSATGCHYGGLIMESGQSVTEMCQVCTCVNASIHCSSVCPPFGLPPRPECQLANISGDCCSQWKCPVETHLPYGIKSSVLKYFHGSCRTTVSDHLENFKRQVLSYTTSHMECSNMQSKLARFCSTVQIKVICPESDDIVSDYRKMRSVNTSSSDENIPVMVSLYLNFSSTDSDPMTVKHVRSAGFHLLSILNSSFEIMLDNGQVVTSLAGARFQGMSFACDHGFIYAGEFCILSKIESSFSFKPIIHLTPVQLTANSVVLHWSSIGHQHKKQITGFLVEVKKDGCSQWFSSSSILDSSAISYNLTSLNPDQNYTVQLVALTAWSGKGRWKVGEMHFKTKPVSSISAAVTLSPTFTLTEITVAETSVLFYWNPLPYKSDVTAVNVLYKRPHEHQYQNKQLMSPVSKNHVQLVNLEPNTAYTAELIMFLSSDESLRSLPVHFVTMVSWKHSEELLIAVLVSCSVTVIASLVVIFSCIWWQRKRKKGDNNGFENKIYGIQLENNNGDIQTTPVANPSAI